MISFKYAYLIGDIVLAVIWLFLFWWRRDLRLEILVMSKLSLFWIAISFVFFAPAFTSQVWMSEGLGILPLPQGIHGEDIVYTFLFGGVAAVLYEELLGRRHFKKMRKQNSFIHFGLFPLIIFFSLFISIYFLHLNPYYGAFIGFLLSVGIIWFAREDLFWHSIVSGVFVSIVYFLLFAFFVLVFPGIVPAWWHLSKISGILIAGVPLEEILWGFFFGLFIGPSYEFLMGFKDRR